MSVPVLVGLVVASAALLYVLAPLVWPGAFDAGEQGPAATAEQSLERLRDDLYARIVALDFDRAVGKTDEEEWGQERDELKRQALAILRLLDERAVIAGGDFGDQIEREVRAVRDERAAARPLSSGGEGHGLEDEVEREVQLLRRARQGRAPTHGSRDGR